MYKVDNDSERKTLNYFNILSIILHIAQYKKSRKISDVDLDVWFGIKIATQDYAADHGQVGSTINSDYAARNCLPSVTWDINPSYWEIPA
jgi:hypothetical protein